MTEHTPGPWRVSKGDSVIYIRAHDGDRLAEVGTQPYWKRYVEIDVANARLIAAAPDLLEALQEVVAVADRKTDEFDRARAAIAKATGKQSSASAQ